MKETSLYSRLLIWYAIIHAWHNARPDV